MLINEYHPLFKQINIVPRWVIFVIDLFLCSVALLLAKIIKLNFIVNDMNTLALYKSFVAVIIINSIVFALFKTYSGIVRYTSAQDSARILASVFCSGFLFFFSHAVVLAFGGEKFISNPTLIIYSLITFLFLIVYRVIIKFFFMYINKLNIDRKKVIIYGAGEAGVATKRSFDHGGKINKVIHAFVDDDYRKVGKSIDGVKIMSVEKLQQLINKHAIDELIFATYTMSLEKRNEIIELCLENEVNVLSIPSQEAWKGKELKTAQIQNLNIEDLLNRKPIQIDIDGIGNQLKNKRILITGAAGSIGSEIVRQLVNFEASLIILCDQSETALHELCLELECSKGRFNFYPFVGDVRDKRRMEHLFTNYKPHYVYHAAAYKHVPLMEDSPSEAIKTNVLGTKTIADLSVKYGVHKFVMISTDKAVNPTNVMGASKRIAEIYVQSLNNSLNSPDFIFSNGLSYINELNVKPITKFITTRFGNVLGSNGSVIPRFKQQIEKGGPLTVTHPDITRYFMTIPEACRLVLEAGCMGKGGEIFIFDMGKSVRIIELAKKMIRLAGLVPNEDIKIEYTGLRPGEKLYEELLNDNENTLPTHHEKIMIGKVREYVFTHIEKEIYNLIEQAHVSNDRKVVIQMKALVKEFISNNSVFEELDKIQN